MATSGSPAREGSGSHRSDAPPARRSDRPDPTSVARRTPGGEADRPTQVPPKGWLQILKRGMREAKEDQVPLLAAGVAFYAFLSLFPALIATVLLYGLVADPRTIAEQIGTLTRSLPDEISELITAQLQGVQGGGAVLTTVVTIALALWTASGGVSNLLKAVNVAYDEPEKRSFIKQRLLALGLTLAAIVFMIVMLGLVVVLPAVLEAVVPDGPLRWGVEALRWVVLAVLIAAALAVLYRVGPDRDAPKMRWVSTGALIATVIWLLASLGFTIYVANFGNYAKTYGALAGVVVLLFWLWITCYAILLGAEINAESEEQTVKDTTKGPEEPLGQRDAVKADSIPN